MMVTIVVEHSTTASQWQKRHCKGEVVVVTVLVMIMIILNDDDRVNAAIGDGDVRPYRQGR